MWCEAGHQPDSFWHQTPRTFRLVMEAARKRAEAEQERETVQAWQTARFIAESKTKRGLKQLKQYLGRKTEPRVQSPAEMLGNMTLLAARANRAFEENDDG